MMVCSRSGPVEMMVIGTAHQRLQPLEIAARIRRQLIVARDPDRALLPARQLLVHRLRSAEILGQQAAASCATPPSIS